MGKALGFTGVPTSLAADQGPFLGLVEAANGVVTKTEVPTTDLKTITATDALTHAEHGERRLLLGEVGGDAAVTLTLPAATGSGLRFEFWVSVVNTSNYVIKVADATDTIDGSINSVEGGASYSWTAGATDDTITLNGTTTGGAGIGDWLELVDIAANQWVVRGQQTHSGIQATPFSATVS